MSVRRWLRHRAGPVALLLALLLGACAPSAESEPGELRIGLIGVFSSEQETLNAAKLAIEPINAAGGLEIGGRRYKLALAVEFDQDKAEAAVRAATKMINQEQVVAIVGPHNSSNAIPAGAVAEEAGVPLISPLSTNPQTTAGRRFVFRVGIADDFQGRVLAQVAREELGAARAAVLYEESDVYSKGLAALFRQSFEAAGGQVVAFEPYAGGAADWRAALERVSAADPDLLLLPNRTGQCQQAQQARAILGDAPALLGGEAWPISLAGSCPALNGAFFTQLWQPDPANPQSAAFVGAYEAAYGRAPGPTAALTYDAFGLLFAALQAQGQVSSAAARDGLAATSAYPGVSGTITYQNGGDPLKSVLMMRIADGRAAPFRTVAPNSR